MKKITNIFATISQSLQSGNLILLFCALFCINTTNISAQIFSKFQSSVISTPQGSTLGVGWIDFNSDGYLDVFITNLNSPNRVYINNQDGTFSLPDIPILKSMGTSFSGLTWGDYDNNGFNDLFITTLQGNNALYNNIGKGNYVRINSPVSTPPVSDYHLNCNWIDYDNDGWLDLFVPTTENTSWRGGTNGLVNHLYHNNGDGNFTELKDHGIINRGNNQSSNFADMDNDGDMDLFMTEWDKDNWLYENNGNGTFTRITGGELSANTSTSMNSCWGDFNNDGFLDLYVGNGNATTVKQNNMLYFNNGDNTFTKILTGDAVNTPGCTWTCLTVDIDNDGDLDLFIGDLYDPNKIFLNDGSGNFSLINAFDVSATATSGAAFADYDNDGFLDLFVADFNSGANSLFHNNGNNNNWLSISCKGNISNRSAIGARVKVKAVISGNAVWQIRDIMGNQGFRSYNDLKAHFGLGDAAIVDSVVIKWPSGQESIFTDVSTNQQLNVLEEIPQGYLRVGFFAETISGFSPLKVQFCETSICDNNAPITSWSWDFNNDGIEDSNEKDPVFTFDTNEEKDFSVKLTVTNGTKTVSALKENFIHVTPLHMQNISLDCNVSASSKFMNNYPSNVSDGKLNTIWKSQYPDSQWIQIELDSLITVGKIVIQWGGNYSTNYKVLCSQDSITWTDLYSTDNSDGNEDELNIVPVKGKYFKFLLFQCSGTSGFIIREIEIYRPSSITDVETIESYPSGFTLYQNYPNPFNPVTSIQYSIGEKRHVSLIVYDILGKEISVLVDEEKYAGIYNVEFDGSTLSSGVYFYTLSAGDYVKTNKFVLLK